MNDEVKGQSQSTTDLRAKRVGQTEAQLIAAAAVLFLDQGYVATTLTQIAVHAGVAARTVYVRFGTKAELFKRVVDRALVGDAEPVDVAHRPRAQAAMTASTLTERIAAFADLCVDIAGRAGALFEVAAQAEGLEPELADAAQEGRRATSELCRSFWDTAATDGLIMQDLHPEQLAIVTDVLLCADTIVHLRRTHGWSASAHRSLIVDTLTALTKPQA